MDKEQPFYYWRILFPRSEIFKCENEVIFLEGGVYSFCSSCSQHIEGWLNFWTSILIKWIIDITMVENFPKNMQFFFGVQKHVPAISVPVPVPDIYLYGMYKIWDQYNSATHLPFKGWSYHTISCMFLRSHGGKLGGLCLALHWSNIVHVMDLMSQNWVFAHLLFKALPFPPPLPNSTIKLLILVAAAQTPVVHNLCAKFWHTKSICELKKIKEICDRSCWRIVLPLKQQTHGQWAPGHKNLLSFI